MAVSTWLLRLPFGFAWLVLLLLGVRLFVDKRLLQNAFRSEKQRGYGALDS